MSPFQHRAFKVTPPPPPVFDPHASINSLSKPTVKVIEAPPGEYSGNFAADLKRFDASLDPFDFRQALSRYAHVDGPPQPAPMARFHVTRIRCDDRVDPELRGEAEKVRLRGFPAHVEIQLRGAEALPWDGSVSVPLLQISVPTLDRYDATETRILLRVGIPRSADAKFLARMIREALTRLLAHEVDECIEVEGKIAFDPHRPMVFQDLPLPPLSTGP